MKGKSDETREVKRLVIFVYLFMSFMVMLSAYGYIGVETIVALSILWAFILLFAEKIIVK